MNRSLPLAVTAVLLALAPRAEAQQVDHTFIIIIDGLRASEAFDDPLVRFIGPLVDDLAPQGAVMTYVENRAQTTTLPAHQVFVTGNFADYGNTPVYEDRANLWARTPTLFEAYRRQTGAPEDSCHVVSNTPLLHDSTQSLMPGYGEDYGATNRVEYGGYATDEWSWEQIYDAVENNDVALMLVNLHEVDRMGHAGSWQGYTGKATQAANDLVAFWDWLQAHPTYQDRSLLIIGTDHGRHLDGVDVGWSDHGCSCLGCRKTFLIILGPGIRQDVQLDQAVSLLDVAPTVAHLMDIPFPYARGRVLTAVLEDGAQVDPGLGGKFRPRLNRGGDLLLRVSESSDIEMVDIEGAQHALLEVSEDEGETWEEVMTSENATLHFQPAAWTDGDQILVGWLQYPVRGDAWTVRVRRLAPEAGDWEEVLSEVMFGSSTPISNLSFADDGTSVRLQVNNARSETLHSFVSEDGGATWTNLGHIDHDRHFPSGAQQVEVDGTWVAVYSAHTTFNAVEEDPNENTDVFVRLSDDAGDNWEPEIQVSDGDAPSIQPAMAVTPDGVLHLVWADMTPGTFQLFHAESTDNGASFSEPTQLTDGFLGSWEPALAVDGERAYVVWSRFEDLDRASVHKAAIEDGELVDAVVLSSPDGAARTPDIVAMGDCTSLVTWSESDLESAWELQQTRVATSGVPASAASAALSPSEVVAGAVDAQLALQFTLEVEDDDRGADRFEITLPSGFEPTGDAELLVDGAPVEGTAAVDGQTLWLETDAAHGADEEALELVFTVTPPAEPDGGGALSVVLHRGQEPCTTAVDGDLDLAAVADDPGDDDTDDDDTGDDDGCECQSDQVSAGSPSAPLALSALLLVLAFRRRLTVR